MTIRRMSYGRSHALRGMADKGKDFAKMAVLAGSLASCGGAGTNMASETIATVYVLKTPGDTGETSGDAPLGKRGLAGITKPEGVCVYSKAFQEALVGNFEKCQYEPVCHDTTLKAAFDDPTSALYHETFTSEVKVGSTVLAYTHEDLGPMSLRLIAVGDDGATFEATSRPLIATPAEIQGEMKEVRFGYETTQRFELRFGSQETSNAGCLRNEYVFKDPKLGSWDVIVSFLHLKTFSVEKSDYPDSVRISAHRRNFCDIPFREAY